jgi:hypothetical protein
MIRTGWRLTLCHILPALFSMLIVVPVVLMLSDRLDPVVVHNSVVSGDMRPGGVIRVDWSATALRSCDGEVRRRIISSSGIIHEYDVVPTVFRLDDDRAKRSFSREITLPTSIAPGPAIHSAIVRYYCNPLQRWLHWPIMPSREDVRFVIGSG